MNGHGPETEQKLFLLYRNGFDFGVFQLDRPISYLSKFPNSTTSNAGMSPFSKFSEPGSHNSPPNQLERTGLPPTACHYTSKLSAAQIFDSLHSLLPIGLNVLGLFVFFLLSFIASLGR